MSAPVDVLAADPWNVYRELDAEGKLAAATEWRAFAAEPTNGTEYLRGLCIETAQRLESEAAALRAVGGAK